jgi:hypothetical protein
MKKFFPTVYDVAIRAKHSLPDRHAATLAAHGLSLRGVTLVLLLAVGSAVSFPLFCQKVKYVHIKGTIADKVTQEPVPSANVFLTKSNIGTFSNEAGEFVLVIPDTLVTDTLVLSCIGYKSVRQKISALDLSITQTFWLAPDALMLQEVIVLAKKEQAREWAAKALKALPRNSFSKQYLMQAFYRELSLRDSTYVRLIESAVEVQDYGYGSDLSRMKIKVIELRKSEDYLTYGWTDKVIKLIFGESNMLYETVYFDFLRNYKAKKTLANIDKKPFLDEYHFGLEGFTRFDSDSLAIVKFWSDEKQQRPYYEGRLFIRLSDWGVVRMEYGMLANPLSAIRAQNDVFYQGKFFFKTAVDYRKIENRYIVSRVTLIKPQNFSAVNNGRGQQFTVYDFAVHNIVSDKRDFERIKRKESQQRDVNLYTQDFEYNALFWESYNMVKLNPLLKKAQTDLEKEKKLESQFRKE